MEVIVDEHAGFCFGVKRAVDTVYEKLQTNRKIYTYGPIVHNDVVVNSLCEKGVSVIKDLDALNQMEKAAETEKPIVIIRAHGIAKNVYDILESKNFEIVDATCPFVKKIHKIVSEKSKEGYSIVIIGNPKHPEVMGIFGWCQGNAYILETIEQAKNFSPKKDEKIFIVSQTTFDRNNFQDIVEIFQKKGYNDSVADTICNATKERQQSARNIASKVDAMIVIGGKESSNSAKLYNICKEVCENTYFIQTLDDLYLELPKSVRLVGITAGASTPSKLIEEVQNYVRINF